MSSTKLEMRVTDRTKRGAKITPSASKKKPKGKFEKVRDRRVQKKKTAVKNLNTLRMRPTDRTKRGSWHKQLLKKMTELSESYEVLSTKNVRIELSQMLFDTYKIAKTEYQIKKVIVVFRNYARDGRIPPLFTTDEEIADFEKIKDSLDVREAIRKRAKTTPSASKKKPKGKFEKVRDRRVQKKKTAVKNLSTLQKRLTDRTKIGSWHKQLLKKMTELSESYEVLSTKNVRIELSQMLFDTDKIEKTEQQIKEVIVYFRNYARDGRIPPMFTTDEEIADFEKIKDSLDAREAIRKRAKTAPSASKKKPKGKFEKVRDRRVQKKKTARLNIKNKRGTVASSPTRIIGNTKKLLEAQKEFANLEKEPNVNIEEEKSDFGFTKFDDGDVAEFLNKDMSRLLKLPGQEIGAGCHKYTISDLIGYGTFGVVFRAIHRNTRKICALKCVIDEGMIKSELDTMNSINKNRPLNRFLCVPSDAFKSSYDGLRFQCFSMDLLYTDLHNFLFSGKHATKVFPPGTVLSIIGQVSSAVAFLNGMGFIYSDIKAENVMLEKFDLEKDGEKDLVVSAVVRLIDVNTVMPIGQAPCICQTARYRAPETIFRTSLDPRIDSWSIGILGVELLMKDYLIDVEYDLEDTEQVMEHIARIEHALGEEIPNDMWMSSKLNKNDLPNVSPDLPTLNAVWNTMKPSIYSCAIQAFIPSLLKINAGERLPPAAAEMYLQDLLPRP